MNTFLSGRCNTSKIQKFYLFRIIFICYIRKEQIFGYKSRRRAQLTYDEYGEHTYGLLSVYEMTKTFYNIGRQATAVVLGKTKGHLYSRFYNRDTKQ